MKRESRKGVVSMARDLLKQEGEKNEIVAIKKIRMGHRKDGVSITALREIKILQEIHHPNVISLLDVFASRANLNMVLEFCITDLEAVIRDRSILLSPAEVKCCLKMVLEGVADCHRKWVLHRDLKPSNILIGSDGNLKLADFGLGRIFASPNERLTSQVITRWYRPPELLFAAKSYGPSVDIWSVGCIFAELMLRFPYMAGDSDIDQLSKIFQARGSPKDDDWPNHQLLPAYISFTDTPEPDHRMLFTASTPAALDLLNQLLFLNPLKRISATKALSHPYFTEEYPPACDVLTFLEKVKSSAAVKSKSMGSENIKQSPN